jgi:hypothetical protein
VIQAIYNIAFVNSERWLAKSRIDITQCQHGNVRKFLPLYFFVLYYKTKIKLFPYWYLRNRKHFPCFYRVIETRVEVWEKREILFGSLGETSTKCECFHAISSFSQTSVHKCFYNSIGTRKKCFLFPLLNSLLKTIKKINLLILITFIQILIIS